MSGLCGTERFATIVEVGYPTRIDALRILAAVVAALPEVPDGMYL